MNFVSITFLTRFLPCTIAATFSSQAHRDNALLLASLCFYWFAAQSFFGPFLALLVSVFLLLKTAEGQPEGRGRDFVFLLATILPLFLLIYVKYGSFFLTNFNIGFGPKKHLKAASNLPAGISFFTFQLIAFVQDFRKGEVERLPNFQRFLFFISFFPQLIAGPIVRYSEVRDRVNNPNWVPDSAFSGLKRFLVGLSKKVLIADILGEVVDAIFNTNPELLAGKTIWLAAVLYALQIFFDFSGYTDMAIGLGRIFGFQFPENFDRPYAARNLTDFWRRWHITLSRWFRDYLYIPLGGNRKGTFKTFRNLATVFFLCGLWHGSNWTFVFWGLLHGSGLIFERASARFAPNSHLLNTLRWLFFWALLLVGWILFRSTDIHQAYTLIDKMLRLEDGQLGTATFLRNGHRYLLGLAVALAIFPSSPKEVSSPDSSPMRSLGTFLLLWALYLLCLSEIQHQSHPSFLYFKF